MKHIKPAQTDVEKIWPPPPQVPVITLPPAVNVSWLSLFSRLGGFTLSLVVLVIGFLLSPTNRELGHGGWHTATSDPLRYQAGLILIITMAASSIAWSAGDIIRTWKLLQSNGKGLDALKFVLGFLAALLSVMAVNGYHVAWTVTLD